MEVAGPCWIELTIAHGSENLIYALLHSDGTVNRVGSIDNAFAGRSEGTRIPPTVGTTEQPLLQQLINELTPSLIGFVGEYDLGGSGDQLELLLSIVLGERSAGCVFTYGSNNSGALPEPVRAYARRVIEMTDNWLDESGARARIERD